MSIALGQLMKNTGSVCCAIFLVGILSFCTACNTTQSANRQVSDTQITADVKAKLASNVGASSLTNIDVNTTNGVVTLAGQVQSEDVKQDSAATASSVPGVVKVNDNLQVALEPTSNGGDSNISGAVKSTEDEAKKAGDAVSNATKKAIHEGVEAVDKAADKAKKKTE